MDIDITDIVRSYLVQFSVWADGKGLMKQGGEDGWDHTAIVDQFLKEDQ